MKPEFVKVGDVKYKLNTDFRSALKCDEIYRSDVGDYEKMLAIIYTLYGDAGLEDHENHNKLFELAVKYLQRGETEGNQEDVNMDYKQDWGAIKSSFLSDYGLKIDEEHMHYYDFIDYLSGVTEHSMLSRIRYIRDYDISEEKGKSLREWKKLKKAVELKKDRKEPNKEQEESAKKLWEQLGV